MILAHSELEAMYAYMGMALQGEMIQALFTALVACAPTPPPSCRGPLFGMNAGQWTPTPSDLQVKP